METAILIILFVINILLLCIASVGDYKTHRVYESPLFLLTILWLMAGYLTRRLSGEALGFSLFIIFLLFFIFNICFKPWDRFNTDILALFCAMLSVILKGDIYRIPVFLGIILIVAFIFSFIFDRGRYKNTPSEKIALSPGFLVGMGVVAIAILV